MSTKPLGGEAEWPFPREHRTMTDSGRSSLRLLVRSRKPKRVLIPDFLCPVIPDVLDQEDVKYAFYKVNENLEPDAKSISSQDFDTLYTIRFFGAATSPAALETLKDRRLIEDCVFHFTFEAPPVRDWAGFNSYRKSSVLADGSLVRSTSAIDEDSIFTNEAPFVAGKMAAKNLKTEFLSKGLGDEKNYVSRFHEAELQLDAQKDIFRPSTTTMSRLAEVALAREKERTVREKNLAIYADVLGASLVRRPEEPSFFVTLVNDAAALRARVRERGIFLPSFWPNPKELKNPLYRTLLALPADSRFSESDIARIADAVKSAR